MPVFRINKNKNFITMGKYHLKEKEMSLKAKGLLSQMLSLPDDWDYSIKGLMAINKESYDSIRSILNELEKFGYLQRIQIKDGKGKFVEIEYTIFESPHNSQDMKKPITEKPLTENQGQLNNNLIKELNNKNNIFKKPTIDQVQQYCQQRNNNIDAQSFIDFYESKDWMIGKNKMKDWQACIRTWERRNNNTQQSLPKWFDKQIDKQQMTDQEQQQLQDLIDSF